ncbi:hypothetical protein BGW36DRAFT_144657 [Talaromyces proteolyticus]|uniref:Uncharacterized protein n=1 Tax=Talaromyces proteolyticus TaxID=1131652 RepID=A0AAD4KWB8_9EURO|nr:uncharacterized protein BGW36DRAFT_144657 [Talaromyces proteolyticus]KAH8698358.1 hypothetical protein BGW36DRAFT_144657 [Talaromyces proteolyticus]
MVSKIYSAVVAFSCLLSGAIAEDLAAVYGYTSYSCGNDASFSYTFPCGGIGCSNLGSGVAALGLHRAHVGDEGVTCSAYSESNCEGKEQSMGIGKGKDWGCTNSQIGWIKSVQCYQGCNS